MFGKIKRWMYRGNRPGWIAKILNAFWGFVHGSGLVAENWVTLEVIGRKSGKIISFPIVIASYNGERYVVSMLGKDAQWVKNVYAADGKAYIHRKGRTEIKLEEIPVSERAPILKTYLQQAPGARPHIPVDKDAPLTEFESVVEDFPAFRVVVKS